MNMFEFASKTKMKFPFKGVISVEDLWDLSQKDLDSIYKTLNSQIKKASEESLLTTKTQEDEMLTVQIAIVKHIFDIKSVEAQARLKEREKREQKQKIMAILSEKKEQDLHGKSVEELETLLNDLDK